MVMLEHECLFFDADGQEIEDITLRSNSNKFVDLNDVTGEQASHIEAMDALGQIAFAAKDESDLFLAPFLKIAEVEALGERVTLPEIKAAMDHDGGKYFKLMTMGQRLAIEHFSDQIFGADAQPGEDFTQS